MSLLADHNLPFAAALLLMFLLALAQLFGLGDLSGDADVDIDVDAYFGMDVETGGNIASEFEGDVDPTVSASWLDGLLSFFGIGRIPLTMWLALFLFLFAGIGVGIQSLSDSLLGTPLDRLLAAVLAAVPSLPITGLLSRPVARIMPKDETTAVSLDSLVRRRAKVSEGTAKAGYPARAKVIDHFGHPHFVMVEPHDAGAEIAQGEEVLLVRREGETFFCIALHDARLAPAN